jgi:hypothetical protein
MDKREPPDNAKVVRLRRSGEPTDEERERLASTIFAEQDEVAPFSQGNLVLPSAKPPDTARDDAPPSDAFFEPLAGPDSTDDRTDPPVRQQDATADYFEHLASQTPAEMSQCIAPPARAPSMPGSANLPGDLSSPRRTRLHRRRAWSPSGRTPSSIRIPTPAPLLTAVLGVVVAAGAAFTAIAASGGRNASPGAKVSAHQTVSAPPHQPAVAVVASDHAHAPYSGVRHDVRKVASRRGHHRHLPKVHAVLAADRRTAHSTPSSSAAASSTYDASTRTTQLGGASSQPAATQAAPVDASSSASNAGYNRPNFGAEGVLGPGHSSTG